MKLVKNRQKIILTDCQMLGAFDGIVARRARDMLSAYDRAEVEVDGDLEEFRDFADLDASQIEIRAGGIRDGKAELEFAEFLRGLVESRDGQQPQLHRITPGEVVFKKEDRNASTPKASSEVQNLRERALESQRAAEEQMERIERRERQELRKELWKIGFGSAGQDKMLRMLDEGEEERFNEIVENTISHLEECSKRGRAPYYHRKTKKPINLKEARNYDGEELMTTRIKGFNIGHRSTDDRDAEQFSLAKMLRDGMEGRSLSGIEAEMVEEGREEARSAGIGLSGFMVSKQAFATREEMRGGYENRAGELSVTGGSDGDAGGVLVGTKKIGLLARLTDKLVCVRAGATVFPNLTSRLDFPRITDGSAISGKSENATADKSTASFDTLQLDPNRLPTYMEVSRQLLLQNDEQALNAFLQRHLEAKLLEKMERAFFNGSGTNEASGILQTAGIGNVPLGTDGGAIDHAAISKLIRSVGVANADQNGRFVFNSEIADKLRTTPKLASTDSKTLLDDARPGVLLGKSFFESNAVPNDLTKGTGTDLSAMIFGDFADLYIAQWSGVEFLVDPLTKAKEGLVVIHANIYYDAGVIRPASFAAINDAITA